MTRASIMTAAVLIPAISSPDISESTSVEMQCAADAVSRSFTGRSRSSLRYAGITQFIKKQVGLPFVELYICEKLSILFLR